MLFSAQGTFVCHSCLIVFLPADKAKQVVTASSDFLNEVTGINKHTENPFIVVPPKVCSSLPEVFIFILTTSLWPQMIALEYSLLAHKMSVFRAYPDFETCSYGNLME